MPHYSFGLGIILFVLSAAMGGILILAPGSIRLQRPDCGWVGWAFNIMLLLVFLMLIPGCSVLMILEWQIPLFFPLDWLSQEAKLVLGIVGLVIFSGGTALLLWSRLALRRKKSTRNKRTNICKTWH